MVKQDYLQKLTEIVNNQSQGKNWQVFLFGSSITKKRFGDLDIGIMGNVTPREISTLKELFINSALPYEVDVVDFNKASEDFKRNVFNNKIIWIKH